MNESVAKQYAWLYLMSIGIGSFGMTAMLVINEADMDGIMVFLPAIAEGIAAVLAFTFPMLVSYYDRPMVRTGVALFTAALYANAGFMSLYVLRGAMSVYIANALGLVPSVISLVLFVRIMRYERPRALKTDGITKTKIDMIECGGCTNDRKHEICKAYRAKMNPRK